MRRTSLFCLIIAAAFAFAGCDAAFAQDTNFAYRLPCELQSASPSSLVDLEWQQGTTPHIAVSPLRLGKPVPTDTLTTVRMIIGTSGTVTNYAQATNWLATNSIYYVQWPTIGTNSGTNAWWYTVYFERDGRTYWTGNGRLFIEETTSTASNGLVWQTISYGAAVDTTARAQIGALSNYVDVVASTGGGTATVTYGVASNTAYRGDWGASVSNTAAAASSTGTAAYALAAAAVATNNAAYTTAVWRTGQAYGWGNHAAAGYATGAQGAKADTAVQPQTSFTASNVTAWSYLLKDQTNPTNAPISFARVTYDPEGDPMAPIYELFGILDFGGKWSQYESDLAASVRTNHTGNVRLNGILNVGTGQFVSQITNNREVASPVGIMSSSGGLLLSRPYSIGSYTNEPAYISMGWDHRVMGRAALWLNSSWTRYTTNYYDGSAEIYFGTGTNMQDSSIRWAIASRSKYFGGSLHDLDQFAIFEGPDGGATTGFPKRLAIFPTTTNNAGGTVWVGYDTRFPSVRPPVDSTFVVGDWSKSPVVLLEGNTNAGAASYPRIRMVGGTNVVDVTWSNGVLYASSPVSVPSMVLGTNPAISDWPSTGVSSVFGRIGAVVAASGDYTASQVGALSTNGGTMGGIIDMSYNDITNVHRIFGEEGGMKINLADAELLEGPTGQKWTLEAESIKLGGVSRTNWPPGITNGQTGVTLAGTFSGNAAGLTNFPLSVWANGINYPASPSNTFNLGTISGGTGGASTNHSGEAYTIVLAATNTAPAWSSTNAYWAFAPSAAHTLSTPTKADTNAAATVRLAYNLATGITATASGFDWPVGIVPPFNGTLEFYSAPATTNWSVKIASRRIAGVPSAYDDAVSVWWPSRTGSSVDLFGRCNAGFVSVVATGTNGWTLAGDTTNHISLGKRAELEPRWSDVSWGAWVYPTSAPAQSALIMGRGFATGGNRWAFLAGAASNFFLFVSSSLGDTIVTTPTNSLPVGSWTHVAVSWDRRGLAKLYVNGACVVTNTTLSNSETHRNFDYIYNSGGANDTPTAIGNYYSSGGVPASNLTWPGHIDAAAWWRRALTDAEVLRLYNAGRTP